MIRCIAIDDEQLVRELLEDNIRQVPFLQLVKTCRNAMEALEVLQQEQIDLIFLDIQMPRLNGLQLLQSLQQPPMVILVTAYEEYALQGFNLQVVDYLLKPFSFERFLKACNRASELFRLRKPVAAEDHSFFVHVEYTQVKIHTADINYIEGLKDYIKIHLSGNAKPVLTRMTMKGVLQKLPGQEFIRVHRSFIVPLKRISSVRNKNILLGDKTEIPIGVSYEKEFFTRVPIHR